MMNCEQGIEKKLCRWFLFISLVPLIIVGMAGISYLRSSLWEAQKKEIVQNIAERQIALTHLAASYQQQLKIFAANKLPQDLLARFNTIKPSDRFKLIEKAYDSLKIEVEEFLDLGSFVAIRLLGKEGETLLNHERRGSGNILSVEHDFDNKSGETDFDFITHEGHPYLMVSGPVLPHSTEKTEAIGHILLVASLEQVDEILSTSSWPVFLFNQKKELIRAYPGTALEESIPESIREKAVQENPGISEIGKDIFVYHHAEAAAGVLVTVLDRDAVFAPITQLTYFFSFGALITLFIVIVAASKVSKKIIDPIYRLYLGIEAVAEGKLKNKVDIKTGDEIEALAERFNEMIDQIHYRTKDLSDLKYAIDQASIVAITDQKGIILSVNDQFCELSKYSREELIGQDHRIINSGSHSKAYIRNMWETIANGKVWRGHFKNRAKDGSIYWVDSTIVPFLNGKGKPYQYLSIRTNITKQKFNEEEIKRLVQYDELTGLPNRTLFNDRLNQAIKQNRWKKRPFAVMFIDLDRFKFINDTMGHSIGDQLLQAVACRLTDCLREGDTVARMGGDEFTALLPEIAKREDADFVAEKMVAALKKPFSIGNQELFVSGSIGLSLYPDNGMDAETLMKNADAAMYHAKENGRGRFKAYSLNIQSGEREQMVLDSALHFALDREEFRLHYQPLVDLQSGKIIGMEALLRWAPEGRTLVPPLKFIPLAEKNGLILPIGTWVLKTAAQQIKEWEAFGDKALTVSVNVSALQFQQADFVEQVSRIVEDSVISPGALKLELTESLLMAHQEDIVAKLQKLKAIGVQCAIDDFGTGYSSLGYLKRFPVESLKIDRLFIRNLPDDPDDIVLTEAIISLGHNLGLKVVAEGIETLGQLVFLQARECNIGQGYLFSRPISGEAFTELLQKTGLNHCIDPELFEGIMENGGKKHGFALHLSDGTPATGKHSLEGARDEIK